jgi:bacteriocin-like protein
MEQNKDFEQMELSEDELANVSGGDSNNNNNNLLYGAGGAALGAGAAGIYSHMNPKVVTNTVTKDKPVFLEDPQKLINKISEIPKPVLRKADSFRL